MGNRSDPWFLEASPYEAKSYGAYPSYEFDHQEREGTGGNREFKAPNLTLPEYLQGGRLMDRSTLRKQLDSQVKGMENNSAGFDRFHHSAIALLADSKVKNAFDVTNAPQSIQERYGKNAFGWSLLMAKNLVQAGVPLVQVNLGNNETWDTHGNAFPHLKDKLYPPTRSEEHTSELQSH